MLDLNQNYRIDLGAGFHRSMANLMSGLSICITLLFLLAGIVAFYLLWKRAEAGVMKGIVNIYLIIFGICFGWMAIYTFLLPIVFTGLVFALLVAARLMPFEEMPA